MGLSKEEKAQLEALTKKSKEPDAPAPQVSYTLDLSSDSAWERARSLGLIPGGDDDGDDDDEEDEADDAPRRQGRGERFFGTGG